MATLTGSVVSPAKRVIVRCVFQYVDEATFQKYDGFAGSLSAPCRPAPFFPDKVSTAVRADVTELRPATNYRYRLVVSNADIAVAGEPGTFSTTEAPRRRPPELTPEPEEPEEGLRRVRCSKKPCRRVLDGSARRQTWVSPKFPADYGWLFDVRIDGHSLRHTDLADGVHLDLRRPGHHREAGCLAPTGSG